MQCFLSEEVWQCDSQWSDLEWPVSRKFQRNGSRNRRGWQPLGRAESEGLDEDDAVAERLNNGLFAVTRTKLYLPVLQTTVAVFTVMTLKRPLGLLAHSPKINMWGFLKIRDPQVTIGLTTKMVIHDLDDLGVPPWLRKPPLFVHWIDGNFPLISQWEDHWNQWDDLLFWKVHDTKSGLGKNKLSSTDPSWDSSPHRHQKKPPKNHGLGGLGSSAFPQCLYKLLAKLTILRLENGRKKCTFFGKCGKTMVFYT